MMPRPPIRSLVTFIIFMAAVLAACQQEVAERPHPIHVPDSEPADRGPRIIPAGSQRLPECAQPRCGAPGDLIALPDGQCQDDAFEPNDVPEMPEFLPFVRLQADFFAEFDVPPMLTLCPDNDDWFLLPASRLDFEQPYLFVRARVAESGLCGEFCGEVELEPSPENTLGVEVYHAPTMELLSTVESPEGNVWLTDDDPRYVDDLLIRFYAPAGVGFDYRLMLDMRAGLAEDECEC